MISFLLDCCLRIVSYIALQIIPINIVMRVKCCLAIQEFSSNINFEFISCIMSCTLCMAKRIFANLKASLKAQKHNSEAELYCSANEGQEGPHYKNQLNST